MRTGSIDIQLFPNPAADFLNIEIESSTASEVSGNIFNTLGQLQHRFPAENLLLGGNSWRIPVADWPEGVYFLQLKIGAESVTKTFVVNK